MGYLNYKSFVIIQRLQWVMHCFNNIQKSIFRGLRKVVLVGGGLACFFYVQSVPALTLSEFSWSKPSSSSIKIESVSASVGGVDSALCSSSGVTKCEVVLSTNGQSNSFYVVVSSLSLTHAQAASALNSLSGKTISGAAGVNRLCAAVHETTSTGCGLFGCSGSNDSWKWIPSACSGGGTAPVDTPVSCSLGLGSSSLDFGNVAASAFADAGAGNKPDGVSQLSDTVMLNCKNVASASGTLRLTTTNSDGNIFLPSADSKLGFIVKDSSGNMLTPGDSGGVQVNLDSSGQGSVSLLAYPVSVDGTAPDAGSYTATATIVADFN